MTTPNMKSYRLERVLEIEDIKECLRERQALIVHCSRPGRAGELDKSKPLFPEDLRQTINDLENVGKRGISCSVVWPEHQETYGPIGIIVDPRAVSSIKLMHTGDAGYSDTNGGMGSPPSEQALHETFEKSDGHNEWVITQADVRGIFLNLTGSLEVAHEATTESLTEELKALIGGAIIAPRTIEIPEIIDEFPDLPLFAFIHGCLMELSARHPLT